jgi:hypothetical protein
MSKTLPNPDAFIDPGIEDPKAFLRYFLNSPAFNVDVLRQLCPPPKNRKKEEMAYEIVREVEHGNLSPTSILSEFVSSPRTWLTFCLGSKQRLPKCGDPVGLLWSFGSDEWHGPIPGVGITQDKNYYIRTQTVEHMAFIGGVKVDPRKIRFHLVAEVGHDYVAYFWDGFNHSELVEDEQQQQHLVPAHFPYWLHVPSFMNELHYLLGGKFSTPNFFNLLVKEIRKKFRSKPGYVWKDLKTRAYSSGVAVNATSSVYDDDEVTGLESLAYTIASRIAEKIGLSTALITDAQEAALDVLIEDLGSKSYGFILKQDSQSKGIGYFDPIVRIHCYYGIMEASNLPDRFPHMRRFSRYEGETRTLDFLLDECRLGS